MEDTERTSKIEFPDNGVRAVDVPMESLEVRLGDGIIRSKDGNFSAELSSEIDDNFEKARSMIIFSNVDMVIEDVWDEERQVQAGWTPLQGIPETEKFTVDLGQLNKDLVPEKEAQLEIVVFNTQQLQEIPNEKAVRMAKDNIADSENPISTSWETFFLQPAFPFERENIAVENTGDTNDMDYRLSRISAGHEVTVDEGLTSNGNGIKAGKAVDLFNQRPGDYLKLELRAPNGDTTAKGSYTGEN